MIYTLAGGVGVNPDPLTLRELMWMHRGAVETRWDTTAAVMALLANIHRDTKRHKKAFTAMEFHPYRRRDKKVANKADLDMMREKFKLMRR